MNSSAANVRLAVLEEVAPADDICFTVQMFVAAAMMLVFHVPIVHQSMKARSPMPCLKSSGMYDVHDVDIRLVIPCLYMIQASVPGKLRGPYV